MVEPVKNARQNFLLKYLVMTKYSRSLHGIRVKKMCVCFPLSFLWFKSYYNMTFSNTFIVNLLQELSHIHWRLLEGCLDLDSFLEMERDLVGCEWRFTTRTE